MMDISNIIGKSSEEVERMPFYRVVEEYQYNISLQKSKK